MTLTPRIQPRIAASMTALGAAMAKAGDSVASAADSFRRLARALTRCARCGRRDVNPRRLEPELCDTCNDTRFWRLALALLVAVSMVAGVASIVGGAA